jgi:hypothetical protein
MATNENIKSIVFQKKIREDLEKYSVGFDEIKINGKVNVMVKSLMDLYRRSKIELNGYLTEEEATFIYDTVLELDINTNISIKAFLLERINEASIFSSEFESSSLNVEGINEKLNKLTEFQAYTILTMCYEYYHNKEEKNIKSVFLTKG